MRLFWTPEAADDLEKISDFLYERSPTAAVDVFEGSIALQSF